MKAVKISPEYFLRDLKQFFIFFISSGSMAKRRYFLKYSRDIKKAGEERLCNR